MKRFAPIVPLALATVALLTCTSTGVAAKRVVGGTATPIQSAPWAVFVKQSVSGGSLLCSGSILDSLHVLTAAHCAYDKNGAQASITSFSIKAGISNYSTPLGDDAEQDRLVSSVRIHPGYAGPGSSSPDDVAVLALSVPLDLSGPAAMAVSLPGARDAYPAAAEVGLAGFGRQSPASAPDGSLHWLTATIDGQGSCGGFANAVIPDYDAIALCATSPTGSVCTGDSGSGLVTTTGARTIVGVASAGRPSCTAGDAAIFVYVGAPEVLRFIQGDDHPPVAPHKTSSTFVTLSWRGSLRAGNTLTCASGDWGGAPTLTYAFVSSQNGQVLQQGSKGTYVPTAADVRGTVFCRALATNDGGTAVLSTGSTKEIGPSPQLVIAPLAAVAAVRGRTVTVRVVLNAPSGLSGKFGVCITPPVRVGSRVCTSQRVDAGIFGGFPFTLRLRIKATAPLGSSRLTITAVAGVSRSEETVLLRVARA